MELRLYKINADPRKLDKVSGLGLGDYYSTSGTLRYPTNITNPSIIISANAGEPNAQDILDGCNYAYIGGFDRYYFIENKSYPNQGLIELILREDVLQSFAGGIESLTCLVERNEFDFDAKIEDNLIPFKAVKEIDEYDLSGDVTLKTNNLTHNIVICTVDSHNLYYNQYIDNALHVYYPDYEQNERAISDNGIVDPYCFAAIQASKLLVFEDWKDAFKTLYSIMKLYDSKVGFIKSVNAYPFEVPHTDVDPTLTATEMEDRHALYLGNDWVNDAGPLFPSGNNQPVYLPYVNYRFSDPINIARFTLNNIAEDFTGRVPYTHVEIYIPYYGWIELNTQEIIKDAYYEIFYVVDYESGNANVFLTRKSTGSSIKPTILFTNEVQLAVKLPLDSTNFNETQARRNAVAMQTTLSVLSSMVSVGIGVATSNPVAVAGGLISAGTSVGNAVAQNAMIFDKCQATFGSSVMGLFGYQKARVKITRNVPCFPISDSSFAKRHGRPLHQFRNLATLSGMTICGDPLLDSIPCLDEEKKEIRDLLTTGVIL